MINSARPSLLTATACAFSLYQTTAALFLYRKPAENCRRSGGAPGTGSSTAGRDTDVRAEGFPTLRPITGNGYTPAGPIPHNPGETPQRAEGTTKNRRSVTREGLPPGDRISSAAHRPTLQGDRETMREIQPPPCIILYRQQVDRGCNLKIIYSPPCCICKLQELYRTTGQLPAARSKFE